MSTNPVEAPRPHRRRHRPSRLWAALRALVRTRITTGLIVVLPILITLWILRIVFSWLRDASLWVVVALLDSDWFSRTVWHYESQDGQALNLYAFLKSHPVLDWGIDIFCVLLTFFLLYIIGLFAANIFGRRALDTFDHFMERVPVIKTVYRATKQMLSTFSGDQANSYQRVAIVPFPTEKMRAIGFVTNVFQDSVTGEDLCTIFIPTTPNPTSGFLQVFRRGEITEVNWSVEDAFRAIMSAGILKPDYLTIVPNKDLPAGGRPAARAD
jgi:uncharacterized membrane protein